MRKHLIRALLVGAVACTSLPATAHDIELPHKMRTLGLDVGNAYACTPDERKSTFRHQSSHLFEVVLHDHGTEAAYIFAASVGFGAARDVSTIDCEARLDYWEDLKRRIHMGGL